MADPRNRKLTHDQFPCMGCGALLKADSFKAKIVGLVLMILFAALGIKMLDIGFPLFALLSGLFTYWLLIAIIPFITKLYLVAKGPCCLKCIRDLQGIDPARTSSCPQCGKAISPAWLDKMRQADLKQ